MRKIQWRIVIPWSLLFVTVAVLPALADLVWEGQPAGPAQVIAGVDESGNVKRLVLGSSGGLVADIPGPVDVSGSSVSLADIGTAASESTLLAAATRLGAVDESAASTDTASSGLNGRLQRIAQRLTSLIELDPGKCANPWITTIDTTSGADTSLALTGCVSGTCKRVVIDNVGSNPVLIQTNSSTGTAGLWLAGATAHPEMMHSVDLSFGPAVTAVYKSTTGATAPAAYGTIGASELVVSACD